MNEWRDFKTDPPPGETLVLIWTPRYSRNALIAHVSEDGKEIFGGDWGMENFTDIVSHWMPMPEPPRTESAK